MAARYRTPIIDSNQHSKLLITLYFREEEILEKSRSRSSQPSFLEGENNDSISDEVGKDDLDNITHNHIDLKGPKISAADFYRDDTILLQNEKECKKSDFEEEELVNSQNIPCEKSQEKYVSHVGDNNKCYNGVFPIGSNLNEGHDNPAESTNKSITNDCSISRKDIKETTRENSPNTFYNKDENTENEADFNYACSKLASDDKNNNSEVDPINIDILSNASDDIQSDFIDTTNGKSVDIQSTSFDNPEDSIDYDHINVSSLDTDSAGTQEEEESFSQGICYFSSEVSVTNKTP